MRISKCSSRLIATGLVLMAAGWSLAMENVKPPAWKTSPEELLRQAVGQFFDSEADYELELTPQSRARSLQGRFESLHLSVVDTVIQQMPIRAFRIDLRDFQVDMPRLRDEGKLKIYSAADVSYHIEVGEDGLNWLLSHGAKKKGGEPPRMKLGDGTVTLTGVLEKGFLRSGYEVQGKLSAKNEQDVYFVPDGVSIGWLSLPGFVVDMVAQRVNPIATVAKFMALKKVDLKVREVRVTPDALIVSG